MEIMKTSIRAILDNIESAQEYLDEHQYFQCNQENKIIPVIVAEHNTAIMVPCFAPCETRSNFRAPTF